MNYSGLLELCKNKGVSVSSVLTKLGLTTANTGAWKNGGCPSAEVLKKLADYFNVSTDYLLGRNETVFTPAQQDLISAMSDLSKEDCLKALDYIELLKLKRNS